MVSLQSNHESNERSKLEKLKLIDLSCRPRHASSCCWLIIEFSEDRRIFTWFLISFECSSDVIASGNRSSKENFKLPQGSSSRDVTSEAERLFIQEMLVWIIRNECTVEFKILYSEKNLISQVSDNFLPRRGPLSFNNLK